MIHKLLIKSTRSFFERPNFPIGTRIDPIKKTDFFQHEKKFMCNRLLMELDIPPSQHEQCWFLHPSKNQQKHKLYCKKLKQKKYVFKFKNNKNILNIYYDLDFQLYRCVVGCQKRFVLSFFHFSFFSNE
jgi:hypothetical protein